MRRDDLRKCDDSGMIEPVPDDEALDAIGRAAALQHWLTEPCGECDSDGFTGTVEGLFGELEGVPCESCDARGWVPKDGLDLMPDMTSKIVGLYEVLLVPLDWLEDD